MRSIGEAQVIEPATALRDPGVVRLGTSLRCFARAPLRTWVAAFAVVLGALAIATSGAPRARAVWLPQLRLTHIGAVVIHRGETEVVVLTFSGASGFALGESRRVSCVLPVPRGSRVARAAVGAQPFADAMSLVDRLRAGPNQSTPRPVLERVPIEETDLLEGSPAAVDALLRGELRLSGASPPSNEALASYRERNWTYVLARAHPRRAPPYMLGPVVVALPTAQPLIPLRLLARRPPVAIDVVLITALQPVLDRDALARRGLVHTELVDAPDDTPAGAPRAPDDAPLALPFSQLPWGALPASVRAVAAPYANGRPSISWREDELVHVAHVFGRLESVERWTDDLVFDVASSAPTSPPSAVAHTPTPTAATTADEVPTGPVAAGSGCGCTTTGASSGREGPFAPTALPLWVLGLTLLLRGRRFSRDPWQAVNRR